MKRKRFNFLLILASNNKFCSLSCTYFFFFINNSFGLLTHKGYIPITVYFFPDKAQLWWYLFLGFASPTNRSCTYYIRYFILIWKFFFTLNQTEKDKISIFERERREHVFSRNWMLPLHYYIHAKKHTGSVMCSQSFQWRY